MATQTSKVIHHLRRAILAQDGDGPTDGQLLGGFIERRDELAFAALVQRHGPLVWGVCRRLLEHHDAEDAFQATFLVLFHKATSVQPREMVANWLHGVAYQTALHSRRTVARRRARERQVPEMPEPEAVERDLWADLKPLLDQELSRLPDKFRSVLILCDLEGSTRKEASRQLGVPEGTVAGWLARGRELLAKRLARHGVAVSSGALALLLSQNMATAAVPAQVLSATIEAASLIAAGQAAAGALPVKVAALTEGVLKTMLMSKIKNAAVAVLVAVLACSWFGLVGYTVTAGQPRLAGHAPSAADQSTTEAVAKLPNQAARLADLAALAAPADEKVRDLFTALQGRGPERGGDRAPANQDLRATFKSVDTTANTITVAVGGDRVNPPAEKTFALAKDLEVAFGHGGGRGQVALKPGKLSDLPAGAQILLSLSPDQKTVLSILAEGPTVRGLLKTVDPNKGTLTVVTSQGRDGGDEKTFSVAKNAEIGIDDGHGRRFSIKEAKLTDLAGGAQVTLWLTVDQKVAEAVLAEGPSMIGVVKGIEKKTITLVGGIGRGGSEERTFEVSPTATILIDDGKGRRLSVKEGTLADIPPGSAAMARLTLDGGTVAQLRVEGPVVPGNIKSVDATKGTITYAVPAGRGENPEEKTLPVAKDARIFIEGTETKLGDVKIPENGLHASLKLTLDQKMIQAVMTFPGR
jgi:RNA polymerase sigma factor (sigma-70 family)